LLRIVQQPAALDKKLDSISTPQLKPAKDAKIT